MSDPSEPKTQQEVLKYAQEVAELDVSVEEALSDMKIARPIKLATMDEERLNAIL